MNTRSQTDALPWPRLCETRKCPFSICETSGRANCALMSQIRNGTSLRTRTATSERPYGSWVVTHCGGTVQPAIDPMTRARRPLGVIRKPNPMAKARWGRDRKPPMSPELPGHNFPP